MGEDGQVEYLTRVEVYNLVRSGDASQVSWMGDKALPALKTLIDGGEYWEKTQAIEALTYICTDKADRLLRATLENPNWQVREFALGILRGKNIPKLDSQIRKMAEMDPSLYVRAKAVKVMEWRKSEPPPECEKRRGRKPDSIGNRKIENGRGAEGIAQRA